MDSDGAREALDSMGSARRRLSSVPQPSWLFWGLAMCLVVAGFGELLPYSAQIVVQGLALIALFAVLFAAQRKSGVVTRLTRPPARPLRVWIGFFAIWVPLFALMQAAAHSDLGRPLTFFLLALLVVSVGPRVAALRRRSR